MNVLVTCSRKSRWLVLTSLLSGPLIHGQPAAQEGPVQLDDLEVRETLLPPANQPTATAGFSDTPILDTPFSVGVLDSALFENLRVVKIEDALKYEPAATPSYASGSYNYFNVRGNIPTNLIDGERLWSRARYSLENVERVEFLKGPAALRGGFGGPGGAINLVTKRPESVNATTVALEADSWGAWRSTLDATVRLSEQLGTRINFAHEQLDDQWDLPGERTFLSLASDYRPGQATSITADVDYLFDDRVYSGEYTTDTAGRLLALDPRTLYGQSWATQQTESLTARIGLVQHLSADWTARLQLGAYRTDDIWNATYMAPVQPNGDYELYWLGNQGEPNRRRGVSGTASVNGSVQTGGIRHTLTFAAQAAYQTNADGSGDYLLLGVSNLFAPVAFAQPPVVNTTPDDSVFAREQSFIVTDEAALTRQWSVLFGGRYSSYQAQRNDYSASAVVPVGAVMFKPRPDLTTYVSYAESLEPGGVAPSGTVNVGEQLAARSSRQFEIGAKFALLNDRLFLTAAAFDIEAEYYGYTNADLVYVQDGWQDIRGVEFGLTGRLTQRLSVNLGGMLLDALLRDTGDPVQDERQSSGVPKGTATVTFDYETPWLDGLGLNAGAYYTGPFNAYNYDLGLLASAPGHATFDAGLRYRFRLAQTTVTTRLNVTNVFDREAWQPYLYPVEPRTVKLSMAVAF